MANKSRSSSSLPADAASIPGLGSIPDPIPGFIPIHGIDVGPFVDGGDPNLGATISAARLRELLEKIAGHARWTFAAGRGPSRFET